MRSLIASVMAFAATAAHGQFTIELEDYNFEGGQFIDNASPGDYASQGLSTPSVDFVDNTPTTRGANEYRAPSAGAAGLPQTAASGDAERAAGTNEYDLSSVEIGEWTNYTRTFPAGNYTVTARVQALDEVEPFIARLEKVTSDPKSGNQTSSAYGVFLGRNASATYGDLPMTEVNGAPVTIALDGEETLRLATQVGSYNINYLTFTPAASPAPMPRIDIASPANKTGVAPDADLEINLTPVDEANVAAVQILANSPDGDQIQIAELGSPPFSATWSGVPEGTWRLLGIVVDNAGAIGLSSEITIFADGTAPELQTVRGRTTEDVVLTFTEPMDGITAGDAANYTIVDADGTPLDVLSASVTADGRVILATAAQSVGKSYMLTVNNLTDLAGNPLPNGSTADFFGNGPLLQTSLGFVVFEAEHFDRNPDELWIEETDWSTPSGGVSMSIPNGGGGNEMETQLQYDINFVKTGTHYIWYRASAETGNDDSAWLWVDGARPKGREEGNFASMSGFGNQLDFDWDSTAQDGGGLMSFEIDSPGFHTIAVARREDGARFDKFVITTDSNFNPGDPAFGEFGPPLTPREGEEVEGGGDTVEITLDPVSVSAIEHDTITLEAAGEGTEGAVIVFQWQRKEGDEWADIPGATGNTFTLTRVGLEWNDVVVRMTIRTDGDEAISSEATITVSPETTAPELGGVNGQGERISLLFSEPVDEASASDPANYQVSDGLQITDITFLPSQIGVILSTSPQTVGTKYTVTVSNVADLATTPNILTQAEGKFYSLGDLLPQSEDGLLVFEAENFDENSDGLWETDSLRGVPSGGLSVVLPNGGGGNEESKLEYELTFTQTGEHILWYRASGPSGTDDSAWFHLNGGRPDNRLDGNTASMTGFAETPDFVWLSNPQEGGGQMTFNIPEPGVYKIGLARREDGAQFDKFVVTTDPEFNPEDSGPFGPAETRAGAPALPSVAIPDLANVPENGDLVITPDISATERILSKVEYFADGEKIGESISSPFTFTWSRPAPGFYTISAVLIDDVGERVSAMAVEVTVEGDDGGGGDTPTVDGAGKSVVWIAQVDSPAGDGFKQLLGDSQFEVTELAFQDPTAAEQETLNAADVVIVTRKVSSGNYNNQTWDEQVTAPLLLMSAYLSRANRWAWLGGDGLVDDTPESILTEVPEHPIFQNVVLTDGVSGPWHTEVDRGTSIPTDPIANGGTVLATGNGNIIAAEWPTGAVAVGPRMFFAAGSREPADPGAIEEAGKFNLTIEGAQAFLNAVLYMASDDDVEAGPVDISVTRTATGVMVNLSGAAAFDVEYSSSLAADSWTVIASDVTSFEDTDAARTGSGVGFYRGVAK